MNVWITFVGTTPAAVINSLWAACKENFVPDKIFLICTKGKHGTERGFDHIANAVKQIVKEFVSKYATVEKITFPDDPNLELYEEKLTELFEKLKNDTVAVDITPGRKYMSIVLFHVAKQYDNVKKIYYLLLKDTITYRDEFYPVIPIMQQKLFNFKRDRNGSS